MIHIAFSQIEQLMLQNPHLMRHEVVQDLTQHRAAARYNLVAILRRLVQRKTNAIPDTLVRPSMYT